MRDIVVSTLLVFFSLALIAYGTGLPLEPLGVMAAVVLLAELGLRFYFADGRK